MRLRPKDFPQARCSFWWFEEAALLQVLGLGCPRVSVPDLLFRVEEAGLLRMLAWLSFMLCPPVSD